MGVPRTAVARGVRVGCVVLAAGTLASGGEEDVDLATWIDGPIRYVARQVETRTFRQLASDADRALYIDKFWARRDPTPATLTNEYRQIFWERVRAANELFLDSSKPGWKTDRGKIYILYGPPTRIEEDLHAQTGGAAAAGQGLIRWIYEGRPGDRIDLNPVVVVPFVRDAGGEYRVSYDPKLASVFFDDGAFDDATSRAIDRFLEATGAARSELSVMLDLGRLQEVPPQAQVFIEHVETVESYRTHPLRAAVDRYLHPEQGGVVAVVTVDVGDIPERVTPSVLARFAYADDPARPPRLLGEDSFKVASAGGRRLAQGRARLEPGRYVLTVVAVDPESAATGLDRQTVEIPVPSEDLRTSDVRFALEIEPVRYESLASHDEPFYVGPFRMLPRLGSTFERGETIRLFYEVYGGRPPYRVSYRVFGREDDGRWTALGRPSSGESSGSAQGWELPTTGAWPAGAYRVRIEIADLDGHRASSDVPFDLGAEPADRRD